MKLINDKPRLRKILINLINKARAENGHPTSIFDTRAGYENHHNQARSVGGANHHENLTRFTYKQHVFAHHISAYLWYGELMHTWLSMSRNGALTLRQITEVRRLAAEASRLFSGEKKVRIKGDVRTRTQLPKSGYRGVSISPSSPKRPYFVEVQQNKIIYRVGAYADAKQAAIDYDIALLQLVGETDCRNFPELSLMELRRLNLFLRVPVIIEKPMKVKKVVNRSWSEERKAAARGRVVSEESRERYRLARIGKKHSEETKRKMSATRKGIEGRVWSEEQKEHMRRLSRQRPDYYQRPVCPHCGYLCRHRAEEKSHFDNCKHLKDLNRPDKAPCPHCGKFYGLQYLVTHESKCKCRAV